MNQVISSLLRAGVAVLLAVAAPFVAGAQDGLNMPYAQFGIGVTDLPYNHPSVARMGGVAYTRSGDNYINPFNPASYASIGMESFVFEMGANIQFTTLSNREASASDVDGNVGYLLVGLPVTRWWKMAGGLMPYSSADYSSVIERRDEAYGSVRNGYYGSGGTSMAFVGSAFNIIGRSDGTRLQAGFNVGYLMGRVQRSITYAFQGTDTTHYMSSRRQKETKMGNVLFDLGVQYWQPLGERYTLGVGLTYQPRRVMNVDDEALIGTYLLSDQSLLDTVFPLSGEEASFTSTLKRDHTIGLGLSVERNRRWVVAADMTFAGWSGMYYEEGSDVSVLGKDALRTGPWSRYALAFEKIGVMDASTYWGRISWSAGVHTEQGAMRLYLDGAEEAVNEWGFGVGASLPMRKGRSLLTLSVAYSSLGSKDVMRRDCMTIGIAISSCERWFAKRKYN